MASQHIDRLILVFDADSGAVGAFVDSSKKILMLKGCPLCVITHRLAGEKSEWASCKATLGVPVDYVHRDEIDGVLRDAIGDQLPCVVAQTSGQSILLLGPDVLARCRGSVADLKGRLIFYAKAKGLVAPFTSDEAT